MTWWPIIAILLYQEPIAPRSPEAQLFKEIQAKVGVNLQHLPDYTCSETIERFRRAKPNAALQPVDTVHLEVAYVGGQELFGWPGSSKIDNPNMDAFIKGGTVGNGDFAILPNSLFFRPGGKIYYAGDTEVEGKPAIRYNYRVPESAQTLHVQTAWGKAYVAYEGSLWVDPKSLDLIRLTSAADDIPPALRLKSTSTILDYQRVAVAGSTFLLPKSSILRMIESDGSEFENRNTFHSCRQFTGESTLKFDIPPENAATTPSPKEINLPNEIEAEIALETPLDFNATAVGETVSATFRQNVKVHGETIVPKGAMLNGNVTVLEKRGTLYLLELRFASIEIDGRTIDISGRNNQVGIFRVRNGRTQETFTGVLVFSDRSKLARGTVLQFRSRL